MTYLVVARLSDTHQLRGPYQIAFASTCMIGYGLLISESSSSVHYFACFVIAFGLFVAVGIPLAWLPTNNPRYGKRTTATAIQITVCNCSGIMAPFVSEEFLPKPRLEVRACEYLLMILPTLDLSCLRCPALHKRICDFHWVVRIWYLHLRVHVIVSSSDQPAPQSRRGGLQDCRHDRRGN